MVIGSPLTEILFSVETHGNELTLDRGLVLGRGLW